MKLYSYYRSSASYRVRIALNLKGLEVEQIPVNLLKGEQMSAEYAKVNPQGMVPALVTEEGKILTQSLAMIEYLEETHPDNPALLPRTAEERARVRAIAGTIACDIAPVNVLRILKYLETNFDADDAVKRAWMYQWFDQGFAAVEAMLQDEQTGAFCHGDTPSLADCCLIPQLYNARRFDYKLQPYPTICRIEETALAHPAFQKAHPDNQPDS